MIEMEKWAAIRCLKAEGKGTRWIARQLGISRNTVKKALRGEKPPKYERKMEVNPLIKPYLEDIKQMVLVKGYIGSRILEEIKQKDYQGSKSCFYRILEKIRGIKNLSKISQRFETAPGIQSQFDWSPYTLMLGGELKKVTIFRVILGYSRKRKHIASLDEAQSSIFEAIENGFWVFGGATKELVVDNARAMVLNPDPNNFIWNRKFLELCGYYGTRPIACSVALPRSKGKVENPFYFLEQHFLKGREFKDFEDLVTQLARFEEEKMNERVHGTTGEKPNLRFEKEKDLLIPLPASRFVGTKEEFRHANWDCLISYRHNYYSVPYPYAGKNVWVRPSQGFYLKIYATSGKLLAVHNMSQRKGQIIMKKEHYEGLKKHVPYSREFLIKKFHELFPEEEMFLEKLISQQKLNVKSHLRVILNLARFYSPEDIRQAFRYALDYNTFSKNFIQGVLEANKNINMEPAISSLSIQDFPRLNIKRPLKEYAIGGNSDGSE